jgi:hypothetical protein
MFSRVRGAVTGSLRQEKEVADAGASGGFGQGVVAVFGSIDGM